MSPSVINTNNDVTHHFTDAFLQLVRQTLFLIDVDANSFPQDEFHGCRMTKPNHGF